MGADRLRSIEQGQTSVARRILDATPIAEAWTVTAIIAELTRQHGSHPEHRVVSGALRSMESQGLVKEGPIGSFRRVLIKPRTSERRIEIKGEPMREVTIVETTPPAQQEPLDRLANLAAELRDLGSKISAIAVDLESIAIDAEERIQTAQAGAAKLRQLQELLKSLGAV